MPNRPSRTALASVLILTLASMAASPVFVGRADPRSRLRSMPIERRRLLVERLLAFDALDRNERNALARFDAELTTSASPDERAKDLDLLRRYHLWVQSLPRERRQALSDAPSTEAKLSLIHQYREEERKAAGVALQSESSWLHAAAFNPVSLREAAVEIFCWKSLSREQQEEVTALPNERDRLRRMDKMIRPREDRSVLREFLGSVGPLHKEFLAALEAHRDEELARLTRRMRHQEEEFFRRNVPPEVGIHELVEFESSLPPWIRERIAPFTPEAARWRLRVLHFLVSKVPGAAANAARPGSDAGSSRFASDLPEPAPPDTAAANSPSPPTPSPTRAATHHVPSGPKPFRPGTHNGSP